MSTIITDNPYTFTVLDNMNINAVFEDDIVINLDYYPYLTSSVGRSITKTINGSQITLTYDRGSATSSSPAYTFLAWADTNTGAILSTSNPYTFTGSGTINITALTTDGVNPNSYTYYTYQGTYGYSSTVYKYFNDGTSYKGIRTSSDNKPSYTISKVAGTRNRDTLCQNYSYSSGGSTSTGTQFRGNTWAARSGLIAGYSTYGNTDWFAKNACIPPFTFSFDHSYWLYYSSDGNSAKPAAVYFHAMDASLYTGTFDISPYPQTPGAASAGYTVYIRPGATGYNSTWLMNTFGLSSTIANRFTFSATLRY